MTSRTQFEIDRRGLLGLSAGAATLILAGSAESKMTEAATIEMQPLEFDATTVPGLSEKLLTSHHQNNYGGALRRFSAIEAELAKSGADQLQGFQLNGLKREELIAHNSVVLHEIYFAGLSGDAAPSKSLGKQIAADFGSEDAWRNEIAAMGRALAGGSGWALLTWSPRAGRLINSWAADHAMLAAGGTVLAALDMYEHAYAIDYGANAGGYVDAYLGALRWTAASEAFDKAR